MNGENDGKGFVIFDIAIPHTTCSRFHLEVTDIKKMSTKSTEIRYSL